MWYVIDKKSGAKMTGNSDSYVEAVTKMRYLEHLDMYHDIYEEDAYEVVKEEESDGKIFD